MHNFVKKEKNMLKCLQNLQKFGIIIVKKAKNFGFGKNSKL